MFATHTLIRRHALSDHKHTAFTEVTLIWNKDTNSSWNSMVQTLSPVCLSQIQRWQEKDDKTDAFSMILYIQKQYTQFARNSTEFWAIRHHTSSKVNIFYCQTNSKGVYSPCDTSSPRSLLLSASFCLWSWKERNRFPGRGVMWPHWDFYRIEEKIIKDFRSSAAAEIWGWLLSEMWVLIWSVEGRFTAAGVHTCKHFHPRVEVSVIAK